MAVFFFAPLLFLKKNSTIWARVPKSRKSFGRLQASGHLRNNKGNAKQKNFSARENPSARRKEKIKKSSRFSPLCEEKKIKRQTVQPPEKKRGRAKSGTIRRKSASQKFSNARKSQRLKPSPKFPQIKSSGSRFRLL